MSLQRFAFRMNVLAKQVRKYRGRVEDATARRALRELVVRTPADTGEARSNWLVGRGAPRLEVIPPYAPGKNLGINERGNANRAIEAGNASIRGLKTRPIYLSNNTRQIGFLNAGSSKQAPAGFVEAALTAARAEVRRLRIFRR